MVQCCGDMGVAEWLSMIALWATITGFAIWTIFRLFPSQPGSHTRAVLDQKLARGDIDLDTYREARAAEDRASREGLGHRPSSFSTRSVKSAVSISPRA